jgi:hypothetical protein
LQIRVQSRSFQEWTDGKITMNNTWISKYIVSDLADLSTRRKGPQNFQILFTVKKKLGIKPEATRRIAMKSSELRSICRSRFFIMEGWEFSGSPSGDWPTSYKGAHVCIIAVQLSRVNITVNPSNLSDRGVECCSSRNARPYTYCNPGTFKSSVRRGDGKRTPNVGSACKQRRFRFVLVSAFLVSFYMGFTELTDC